LFRPNDNVCDGCRIEHTVTWLQVCILAVSVMERLWESCPHTCLCQQAV